MDDIFTYIYYIYICQLLRRETIGEIHLLTRVAIVQYNMNSMFFTHFKYIRPQLHRVMDQIPPKY